MDRITLGRVVSDEHWARTMALLAEVVGNDEEAPDLTEVRPGA